MLNIGICDDFPIFRELIETCIRQYDEKKENIFNIRQFGSGEELLDWLDRENVRFDLLFLDYYMKKLTGLETAKRIRQLELKDSKAACSIVFVTSMDDPYELMSVHPLRVIRKPVSQEIINDILARVLAEKGEAIAPSAPRPAAGGKEER
jgi:CheY-like chemotaxis protein